MEIKIESSVKQFISLLEKPAIVKVLRTIDLLHKFGYQLGAPYTRKIRNNIFELRIRGQKEIRIFYIFHKGIIILLHGFVKKSQKTPLRELKTAINKVKTLT